MDLQLSRQSRFVRWCWWDAYAIPAQSSVCVLFWRGFVLMPIVLGFSVTVMGVFLYLVVTTPEARWTIGGTLAGVFLSVLAINLKRRRWPVPAYRSKADAERSDALRVLAEWLKATKTRVCPIVRLED